MKSLQNEGEIARFTDILVREGVTSYLEIGSKFGGSLNRVARALPKGSRIVSVDLPHGERSSEPHLVACVKALWADGYDARLLLGDSTSAEVIERVAALGPFDAVFIDANHTLPYVTKDWETYGPMARIVAFHDISFVPRGDRAGRLPIDVPQFWDSIKGGYRHEEIKLEQDNNGIGVLWR